MTDGSADWFAKAQKFLPGGVSSPVRAFGAVGGSSNRHTPSAPVTVASGELASGCVGGDAQGAS